MNQSISFFVAALFAGLLISTVHGQSPPPTTEATIQGQPAPQQAPMTQDDGFDPAEHLTGDWFGARRDLFRRGITIDANLVVDYSKNMMGGLDTAGDSYRERFNFGIALDTEKLFKLHGGTFVAAYQLQHGGNASHELTGDAQNIAFGTNADGRSQLGKLFYQQTFADDTFRLRLGKLDGNDDFDVLENGVEFLNNSFSTTPTLALMPSFPDNGTGIELFYEPKSKWYIGAGLFDGSQARGVHTGEYGPAHFLDRGDDLFLIAEVGKHYQLQLNGNNLPGKIALGGWQDTNPFDRLSGNGRQRGTGGVYFTLDQSIWKPAGATDDDDKGIAACFTAGWCDPVVNRIDASLLAGITETGLVPGRAIDVAGCGATFAHFSDDANTRDPFELAIEMFYRVRMTRFVSLKPDLQYIVHPNGSGVDGEPIRDDALVASLRLEISF